MSEPINNEDITAVMISLCVTYNDAVDLIKNGLNINYIKTGFKTEINDELEKLTDNYKARFTDIVKETLG